MNDYKILKEFWNESLKSTEPYSVNGKWIEEEKFNKIIREYIKEDYTVLDYGCGSGWAIFEAYFTNMFKKGVAIDTGCDIIKINKEVAKMSNISNITFICGDEKILDDYKESFDFAMSFNVLDVIPDEIVFSILEKLKNSLKNGAYIFIGINPDFTEEQLINMIKLEKKGQYFYKDGVIRVNKKSINEWSALFKKYFTFVESFNFTVVEREKSFPRVGFLLKK